MIKGINYNWYISDLHGEVYMSKFVGHKYGGVEVVEITEHPAAGDGDKWYYDILYSDGTKERIFNPNQIFYEGLNENDA